MARNRASAKAAGTAFETAIVNYLRQWYPWVERRAKTGGKDQGDIAGLPLVIEAKNCVKTSLAQWVAEANVEAENAKVACGVVWFKRVGKTDPAAGYVLMDGETFRQLLSTWVEEYGARYAS